LVAGRSPKSEGHPEGTARVERRKRHVRDVGVSPARWLILIMHDDQRSDAHHAQCGAFITISMLRTRAWGKPKQCMRSTLIHQRERRLVTMVRHPYRCDAYSPLLLGQPARPAELSSRHSRATPGHRWRAFLYLLSPVGSGIRCECRGPRHVQFAQPGPQPADGL
jgi:hypothetical protein